VKSTTKPALRKRSFALLRNRATHFHKIDTNNSMDRVWLRRGIQTMSKE
jgi:hypothetical protein